MLIVGVEAVSAAWSFGMPGVDGLRQPALRIDSAILSDDLDVGVREHALPAVVLDSVDRQLYPRGESRDRQSVDGHVPKNTPDRVAATPDRVYSSVMGTRGPLITPDTWGSTFDPSSTGVWREGDHIVAHKASAAADLVGFTEPHDWSLADWRNCPA